MCYPHTRPCPRSLRTPSTHAYAFNTLAYALDAPALDTTHMIQDSHVHPSMPPPSTPVHMCLTPAHTRSTPTRTCSTPVHMRSTPVCTRSTPVRTRSTPMRTLAHMHRPDALHPWPSTHMQACEQVQGHGKVRGGADMCAGGV